MNAKNGNRVLTTDPDRKGDDPDESAPGRLSGAAHKDFTVRPPPPSPQGSPLKGPYGVSKRARLGGSPSSASRKKATSSSHARTLFSRLSMKANALRSEFGVTFIGASKCAGMTVSTGQLQMVSTHAADASGARERMIWMMGTTTGAPPCVKRSKASGVLSVQLRGVQAIQWRVRCYQGSEMLRGKMRC